MYVHSPAELVWYTSCAINSDLKKFRFFSRAGQDASPASHCCTDPRSSCSRCRLANVSNLLCLPNLPSPSPILFTSSPLLQLFFFLSIPRTTGISRAPWSRFVLWGMCCWGRIGACAIKMHPSPTHFRFAYDDISSASLKCAEQRSHHGDPAGSTWCPGV